MRRKNTYHILIPFGILALIGFIYTITHEIQITADAGFATFRFLRFICGLAAIILILILFILTVLIHSKQKKDIEQKIEASRRAEKEKATLSYKSGRLDEDDIRKMVIRCFRYFNRDDSTTTAKTPDAAQFRRYIAQMDDMNAYQARLHTLLELNGASDLNQTEDMMDALKQSLFMNMRKAINWANAVDPNERISEDITAKLSKLEKNNTRLLNTAGELLTHLTDYINHQGDYGIAEKNAAAFIDQLQLIIKNKEEE